MRGALFSAALATAALVATVAQANCRVALLLAVDVSSSVDEGEHDLQRDGLAAALRHADVADAILQGPGEVALAIYEWSGRRQQRVVVDWTMMRGLGDIEAVAATVQAAPRSYSEFPTAMGYALGFGHTMMERAPECRRKVIDLSGDGVTNDGFSPALTYKHFDFSDITVNGLAIKGAEADVVPYFEGVVARGPLSFVEVAQGYEDFERVMVRKLYRELSEMLVGWAE
ncbi:DUF1194 domain-containing protein [Primorskyibacter sp. S187A]|uniref:DUF1194 domain-containing protein n=1 Tax=Primorskyibacter sp. S187A TaxID=3415130 RepID=UPI003C7C6DD3